VTVITDTIAEGLAELAALGQVVATPTAPLDYGSDISCSVSVSESLAMTDPHSAEGIAELAIRRVISPRGSNPADPTFGIDLRALAGMPLTPQAKISWQGRAEDEIKKESDTIAGATVTLSQVGLFQLDIWIKIVPHNPRVIVPELVVTVENGEAHYRKLYQ
jgi:hypothetical protein